MVLFTSAHGISYKHIKSKSKNRHLIVVSSIVSAERDTQNGRFIRPHPDASSGTSAETLRSY
ncbi:hypothetical protein E2C01_071463 [Portunus trituberculatus]|uniref:Uncharacterized protein n=1 Tax=Portunus trituberculatus TaxID=210409 RepID=A0A5B7I8A2_PORTR|nr:hypothetical protein [Portunus trituberculatus]